MSEPPVGRSQIRIFPDDLGRIVAMLIELNRYRSIEADPELRSLLWNELDDAVDALPESEL